MDPQLCQRLHILRRTVLAARTTGRVIIEFHDGQPTTDLHEAR